MSNNIINPDQTFRDSTGAVRAYGTITVYDNNTTTKATIYSDADLTVTQSNPYTLDAYGRVIGDLTWAGLKTIEIANANGSDVFTRNDVASTSGLSGEWSIPVIATYVSDYVFTLVGDQTTNFHVGRRIKLTGGADRYATISASIYTSLTTITVKNVLDNASPPVAAVLHSSMTTAAYHIDSAMERTDASSIGTNIYDFHRFRTANARLNYGAVADGTTDDRTALNNANTDGPFTLSAGTHSIQSALTISSAVTFEPGAILKPANGITITISGPVKAEIVQIFDISAGGTVTLSGYNTIGYPEWWGAVSGAVDNSTALQAAMDSIASNQGTMILSSIYQHNTALNQRVNLTIEGRGPNFTTGFKPIDCSCLRFDHVAEGNDVFNITLKNFMVDCGSFGTAANVDAAVYWAGFYRCKMDNIRLRAVPIGSGTGEVSAGVKVDNGFSYENRFERVYSVGGGNTGAGRCFDIDHTAGGLVLEQCDPENAFIGIYLGATGGGMTEIITPHIERCGSNIWIKANHDRVLIRGGTLELGSATTNGIVLDGAFTNDEVISIDGLRFTSDDHVLKKSAIVTSNISSWTTQPMQLTNIDWSWINVEADLSDYANFVSYNPNHTTKRQEFSYHPTLADTVSTNLFKITAATNVPIYVKTKTFVEHNGYGLAVDESVWMIVKNSATGTYYVTTKANLVNQIDNNAANYNITTLTVTATPNTTTDVTWDVNCDFVTTIVTTVDAWISVEVLGTCSVTDL